MRYSVTRENELDYRCLARDHQQLRVVKDKLRNTDRSNVVVMTRLQREISKLADAVADREAGLYRRLRREYRRAIEMEPIIGPRKDSASPSASETS